MGTPFKLIWTDVSNNILSECWFPISFPGITNAPQQVRVRSNAIDLKTFETLTGVKLFLTGNSDDINAVQNVWPILGNYDKPELNGGIDISFDFGRTYIRFDSTHGVESNPSTWLSLPAEAIGTQGAFETLGAFDIAHFILRYIIPPGAKQYRKLDIRLGMDFDII